MLIRERMENTRFSSSEQNIVDYLLTQKSQIRNMTTKEIAAATFTSPSTLIRIAHKMGFEGWQDLKEAWLREEDYLASHFCDIDANRPFENDDTLYSIAAKIATLKQEAIADTFSLIDAVALHHAVTWLKNASQTAVFAVSNNALIIQEFIHNMQRIGRMARAVILQGELVYTAALLDPKAVAIIVSYSGETVIFRRVIEQLKEKKIKIIALTSIGDNYVAAHADLVLRLCTREKLYSKIGTFCTDASIAYVLDVLYSGVFSTDYDHNLATKIATSRTIERRRTSTVEILREEDQLPLLED